MSEQEKKRQGIYCLLNAETKAKEVRNNWSLFVYRMQSKDKSFTKKNFLRKMVMEGYTKTKRRLFNCSRYSEQEGPNNINKKAC